MGVANWLPLIWLRTYEVALSVNKVGDSWSRVLKQGEKYDLMTYEKLDFIPFSEQKG